MRILIAGGSGFLGRELSRRLMRDGHELVVLTRRVPTEGAGEKGQGAGDKGQGARGMGQAGAGPRPGARSLEPASVSWTPDGTVGPWAEACGRVDVVVNLAGESIATRRWSAARKHELADSRMRATRSLAAFIAQASPRPSVFVSSSAIGYYGDRGDAILDESAAPGGDFLAGLGVAWEAEAHKAGSADTRVVVVRTGIVLDPREGALAKMLLPFRLFAGGPFWSGRQYMSWIHRDDWVSLVQWCITTPGVAGPVNAVAPGSVTNADFARTLGRVLHRPAVAPVPGFVLKIVLGEMAGPLLLSSQRVVPAVAQGRGFTFAFPTLEGALGDLLGTRGSGLGARGSGRGPGIRD